MLIRVFGLFGIVLGGAYFNEGLAYIGVLPFALAQKAYQTLFIYLMFVTWDFLFGVSLIVAGIGLLFMKDWARIMLLGLMPVLAVVHLSIIMASVFLGRGVSNYYLFWTGMVVFVAALSWWYLTDDKYKAYFSKQKEIPT